VNPWDQGRNFGVRPGVLEGIRSTLTRLASYGRKVSLIGWSLGGLYARELAKELPDAVRLVITLGSPFAGEPVETPAARLYEWVSGCKVSTPEVHAQLGITPPVPTTSIWSRSDGVVAWQRSVERSQPLAENIEVRGSHCGLGMHPMALFAIADRLAQPEGRWAPFQRDGWRKLAFGDTERAEQAALEAEA
jgi:pimeloyl-ACP methyl ester carboxylesterase